MDDAINKSTRKRVQAAELVRHRVLRTQDYVCPGCGNPVHLRAGTSRAPHFAHLPHYDTEDCSYYHPGVGGGGVGVWERAPSPLPLYLEIRTGSGGQPIWTLQLAIPRVASPRGRITLLDGITGRSSLSCAALESGGRRVQVKPQQTSYRIEASPDVSEEAAERLTVGSPGLDPDAPTLFRAGGSGGRRLADEDDLTWGDSYFAIWRSESAPTFPRGVAHQELASLDEWYRGGVFQLPLEVDDQVRKWVEETLFRRVAAPGVILSVMSPLTLPGVDEELEVDSREDVVLAIKSPTGTNHLRDLTVVDGATGLVRQLTLKSGPDVLFVSIGTVGQRRITLSLENKDGDSEAELTLEGRQHSPRLAAPSAELVESHAEDQEATSVVPLHSLAASRVLISVRDGDGILQDVRFPPCVTCQIRANGRTQQLVPGTNPEHRRELLRSLEHLLGEGSAFEIDAQSFGRVALPARKPIRTSAGRSFRLPAEWRRRIRALSALSTSRKTAAVTSLEPQVALSLYAVASSLGATDAVLLRNFAGLHWDIGVLPQVRALATDLLSSSCSDSQRSERIS